MTAAIYARVSTTDQKYEMQLTELRQYAARAGWWPAEYLEKESSGKVRPVFELLMRDAAQKKFDVVVVWKMDRFARSMKQFIDSVRELDRHGIRFIAMTQGIDTDRQSAIGTFLMHILAAFAELERAMIVERTKAGVAEARRQGKHCGRPRKIFRRDKAQKLRAKGMSWRQIEKVLGVPEATIRLALKGAQKVPRKWS